MLKLKKDKMDYNNDLYVVWHKNRPIGYCNIQADDSKTVYKVESIIYEQLFNKKHFHKIILTKGFIRALFM